jgi:hypothetical protein
VPRCDRAPDCGDGYSCDADRLCHPATKQIGDTCVSEVDCEAGLSCQIEGTALADDGYLLANCVGENAGRPAGALCETGGDCRNGTCDLGHCVDLCTNDRDCGTGTVCTVMPRLAKTGEQAKYRGCLQAHGSVHWTIPLHSSSEEVHIPVPGTARSVSLMFSVDDENQKVGATQMVVPVPECLDLDAQKTPFCDVLTRDYYTNPFTRHRLEYGASVLAMPISPAPEAQLQTGVYKLRVRSQRQGGVGCPTPPCPLPGTATPTVNAVIKVEDSAILDLHFYFLNLEEHPCASAFGGTLDAATAQGASYFEQFLGELKNIIGTAVYFDVGNVTYEDLGDHPDLDGLDVDKAPALLSLGAHSTGVNVFFVRTLSPIGLQAFGPNPGPAGLAHTRNSGIVIGVDTLCYRSWRELARLTAHEIARYMGLFNNVGIESTQIDPISDTDMSSSNLMFYSELGGTVLTDGQKQVLRRSAVLR